MKEVALRADVAVGTLYRYFPSKDHVLLAIALDRYEVALQKLEKSPARGATPGARVADYLLRQFRAEQREPLVTAATARVIHDTDRKYTFMLERISGAQQRILRHVARGDGPEIGAARERTLVLVASCFGSATRGWLSGVSSSADARFQIKLACCLLDLPEAQLDATLAEAVSLGGDGA